MAALKRRNQRTRLERRVRPRIEKESDLDEGEVSSDAAQSSNESEDNSSREVLGSDEEESDNESEASSSEETPAINTAQLSFGALARAQASLPGTRKHAGDSTSSTQLKLGEASERSRTKPAYRRDAAKRSSKHAPAEMTSKKPVSLRRNIIEVPKVEARDPRFGPLAAAADESKTRKAYAFLDKYRDDEMKQLKAAMRKTKDPEAKEEILQKVRSMESRKKTQERKDRERAVIEDHRKQEKELIRQGKKPFFLKKAEQKKRLLMDQYANMNKRQVDKLIERRRKKASGKEKKTLPMFRRGAEPE